MPDRMPGRLARPWCPYCRGPAGPDCGNSSPSRRQVRRRLARELRREVADHVPGPTAPPAEDAQICAPTGPGRAHRADNPANAAGGHPQTSVDQHEHERAPDGA